MRPHRYLLVILALLTVVPLAYGNVITIKTGQVGGAPGTCSGADDSFNFYAPQSQCGLPLVSAPFQPSDFDAACNGTPAIVIDPYPVWMPQLNCDPDARWIDMGTIPGSCFGNSLSALYCAPFVNDSECTIADSVKVCWAVDDALGDPAGNGLNPGGVYINGVDLGPAFSGGAYTPETVAVAYNVPILVGANRLEVYQRDLGCAVAGVILSCTIYVDCTPVPTENQSWGAIKALYR